MCDTEMKSFKAMEPMMDLLNVAHTRVSFKWLAQEVQGKREKALF